MCLCQSASALIVYVSCRGVDHRLAGPLRRVRRQAGAAPRGRLIVGRLMDHGTDALMAVFVLWRAQLLLQYPSRLTILGQAVSSVGSLIMQWTEHYTGAFPIYLALSCSSSA